MKQGQGAALKPARGLCPISARIVWTRLGWA
jgi:hypothetical protein